MMRLYAASVLAVLLLTTPLLGAADTFEGAGRIDSVEAAEAEVIIRGEAYRIEREMVWEAQDNEGQRVGLRSGQYVLFSGIIQGDRRVIDSIVVTPRAEPSGPVPREMIEEPSR